jgi:hypothetical protein
MGRSGFDGSRLSLSGPACGERFAALELGHDAVAPEPCLRHGRYAALAPFGKVAVLLFKLLSISEARNARTV